MNAAIDSDDGIPRLRKLAADVLADWQARLRAIVADAIDGGEIGKNVEPRQLADTIIATLEGAVMISRLEGERTALCDAQESLLLLLNQMASARRPRPDRVTYATT